MTMATSLVMYIACIVLARRTLALLFGEQCDASPIYTTTWQYDDSCQNVYLFCDPTTNTCNYKGCSNSDYLKGWNPAIHTFRDRCNSESYCPDNNSKCLPLVSVGGRCEPQRDDECAGQNAICLNSTCFVKAAPLGGNCASDVTDYVSYDAEGYAVNQRIIRDNCTMDSYCAAQDICIASKALGQPCEQDRECLSGTCSGITCISGPDQFRTVPVWVWAILGLAVLLFVFFILGLLWILHRYQSKKERAERAKFFGDNHEFAKYAMLESDSDPAAADPAPAPAPAAAAVIRASAADRVPAAFKATMTGYQENQRPTMVFLTTPDYQESAARAAPRPLGFM